MARVSVDDTVWRGPRELRLRRAASVLAGREWSQRELVGTLVAVWSVCYDQVRVDITTEDVDTAADLDGFAKAMVDCKLARKVKGGRVEIAGATKHVAYLLKQSALGSLGAEVKKLKALEKAEALRLSEGSGKGTLRLAPGEPEGTAKGSSSYSPAPDTAPDPAVAVALVHPAGNPPQPPDSMASGTQTLPAVPLDRRRVTVSAIWEYARERHAALKAEGIDPNTPEVWNGLPAGRNATNLSARLTEIVAETEPIDYDRALAECRRVVDVAEAQARRSGSLKYLAPSWLFDPDDFAKKRDTNPDAAQPRAAGRPPEPKRTIPRL